MVDCSAAVENLLLKTPGPGYRIGLVRPLSATGAHGPHERLAPSCPRLLPHALVPLGYPAQEFKRVERFKPERIHRNGW